MSALKNGSDNCAPRRADLIPACAIEPHSSIEFLLYAATTI
jgi:hypothetical protein